MDMINCDTGILTKRTINDIPRDIRSVIDTVTANMNTLPVGTFKYKIFKYPSDIDIFEKVEGCCTYNNSKIMIAEKIQRIIHDIVSNPKILFSDFKAGYDERFKIYTGYIDSVIEDYNPLLIRRDLTNLYEARLLCSNDYYRLLSLVKDYPSGEEYNLLNEELRNFWVVRWTAQELLQGYKILAGNYKLFLDVAITQGSIVKLDVISPIEKSLVTSDGKSNYEPRYIEVTNFFVIEQLDRYGNVKILSEELKDYQTSLLSDFFKYYPINPLKAIKRLWMFLVYKEKVCELNLFRNLFTSEIALFSQIAGDIEVALNLLNSNLAYDPHYLFETINMRINKLNGFCVGDNLYQNSSNIEVIKANMKILHDCIKNKVNEMTYQWIAERNIDLMVLTKL